MIKKIVIACVFLTVACSTSGIQCDNASIKKALEKKAKEAVTKSLSAESVEVVKLDSIRTAGTQNDTGKKCEADIYLKVKKSKYNADYDVKIGD